MNALYQGSFIEVLSQLDEQMREKCVLIALACSKTPADLSTHAAITEALLEIFKALPKNTTTPSV